MTLLASSVFLSRLSSCARCEHARGLFLRKKNCATLSPMILPAGFYLFLWDYRRRRRRRRPLRFVLVPICREMETDLTLSLSLSLHFTPRDAITQMQQISMRTAVRSSAVRSAKKQQQHSCDCTVARADYCASGTSFYTTTEKQDSYPSLENILDKHCADATLKACIKELLDGFLRTSRKR